MNTAARMAYACSFDDRVRTVLPEAARRCPGLARRLAAAGVDPADLTGVAALDRLPVLSKDHLIDLQREDPPFAGLVAPDAPVRRVFRSPGPLHEAELDRPDPWRWTPALRAAGFTDRDLVLNAFSYHLSPAGAMFEEAARALGCRVVPGGIGNLDQQVQTCLDLGVTAYIGLPSYLKALLERADEAGSGSADLRLARAFVAAEPLPDSLRARLTARVPVVLQGYGTAETGNLGYEVPGVNGLQVPTDALVQICDLATGEAVYDGRTGEVVVTIFEADAPVVRFGTGDLSAWADGDTTDGGAADGGAAPRIRGWIGRVGDAVKVRGMFLHPRQVSELMATVAGVDSYRFVVDRVDHRDVLRCELAHAADADPEVVAGTVRAAVRDRLRFDIDVRSVGEPTPAEGPIVDVRDWDR